MPPEPVAELRLSAVPESAGEARRFVTAALERWGREEFVDDAALATSELVTNAALHAGTDIAMRVLLIDDGVRVEVHDDSAIVLDTETVGQPPPSPEATTGRGFQVVATLASRWGVVAEAPGKTAWFELAPGDSERGAGDDGRADACRRTGRPRYRADSSPPCAGLARAGVRPPPLGPGS